MVIVIIDLLQTVIQVYIYRDMKLALETQRQIDKLILIPMVVLSLSELTELELKLGEMEEL